LRILESQIKRNKQNEKRRLRNRIILDALVPMSKRRVHRSASGIYEDAVEPTREAISALDKAVEKGIIHKNNAGSPQEPFDETFEQA